jgi:hypothetical protein
VLEYGGFITLALLAIWAVLLIPLTRGKLKAVPFSAVSAFLALMIPFFWLGPEITELTILKVGSFKTNAEQANRYFDEIKTIREKIEIEAKEVNAAIENLKTQVAEAQLETQKIKQRMADRSLTGEQEERIKQTLKDFSGQQFQMITYPKCDECSHLFMTIYHIMTDAGWVREGPPVGIPIGAMSSVIINVSDNANDRTKAAGRALAAALNADGIVATFGNETGDVAIVDIMIGLKP